MARRDVGEARRVTVIDRLLLECREADPDADRACPWCGRDLPPGRRRWCSDPCRADFVDNHFWGHARARALARDGHGCQRCGARRTALEVHHVEPRRGRGYAAGCHHHLDLLETLCRRCHVAATNAQRAASATYASADSPAFAAAAGSASSSSIRAAS